MNGSIIWCGDQPHRTTEQPGDVYQLLKRTVGEEFIFVDEANQIGVATGAQTILRRADITSVMMAR